MSETARVWSIRIAGVLLLALGYWLAFDFNERAEVLEHFDSVTSLDIAQVGLNTLHGDILQTRLLTPVSYATLGRLDAHPDFLRYPLPVFVDTVLFFVFGPSATVVKFLNGFLFIVNGALMAGIVRLLVRTLREPPAAPVAEAVSQSAAISTSFGVLPYLGMALSDDYEVLCTTMLLLVIGALLRGTKPLYVGILCALLQLSRGNMGLLIPLTGLFVVFRRTDDGLRAMVRDGLWFSVGVLGTLLPFMIRSVHYTSSLLYSLQHQTEVAKGVTGGHLDIYTSFETPPGLAHELSHNAEKLEDKFYKQLSKGVSLVTAPVYWAALVPALLAGVVLPRSRRVLTLLWVFLVVHVAVLSLYVQKNRIYLPIIMGLGVLGIGSMWVGIQQFLAHSKEDPPGWTKRLLARVEKLPAQVVAWLERDRLPIRLLVAAVLVACMSLWQSDTLGFHEQHNRTTAPDPDVREQLAAFDLDCVYSNNQFWLVWETDLTVMEAPRKPSDIAKYGPERCRHFVFDRRHRRKPYERYLKRKATELYRGKNYVLYELPR